MTESQDKDPIGSVADEARKLFESIQGRATRQVGKSVFNSFTGGGRKERDVWEEAVSEPHEEYICRACPVCRAMAAQRESGGDVAGHLMAAGGELVAAFRGALDALSRPAPRTSAPRERTGDGRTGDDGRRDGVEHIDLN
ncbi:hypothetical protein FAF44_34915 [Nonomuraea sp. MG754425]|uniref:DUF5304 family protein n=1 Tax=Nonomuraea sp. MG754425 TaxID=2570319 RepID=UPI001F15A70F|nr:DUF5304 family protein [Nonomuraea sp. MG754425]MCF6473541.1 hypothetical protein [Nonomuraea sp. MG754425]